MAGRRASERARPPRSTAHHRAGRPKPARPRTGQAVRAYVRPPATPLCHALSRIDRRWGCPAAAARRGSVDVIRKDASSVNALPGPLSSPCLSSAFRSRPRPARRGRAGRRASHSLPLTLTRLACASRSIAGHIAARFPSVAFAAVSTAAASLRERYSTPACGRAGGGSGGGGGGFRCCVRVVYAHAAGAAD